MITPEINAQNIDGKLARPQTYYGLSTDEKPLENVANGSKFIEMDTRSLYLFNLEDEEWDEWSSGGGGGGSSTLSGLTDVDISNPTDGQTLVYNATSGKWENGESAGGGVLVCVPNSSNVLNHTWQELADAPYSVLKLYIEGGDFYSYYPLSSLSEFEGEYYIEYSNGDSTYIFSAVSPNDYPRMSA